MGGKRRTPTLSISLTPELLAAVNTRIASGLYTTASEVIREALRHFLADDPALRAIATAASVAEPRSEWRNAGYDLFALGAELRRMRADLTGTSPEAAREAADLAMESDAVIQPSPDRLRRLLGSD